MRRFVIAGAVVLVAAAAVFLGLRYFGGTVIDDFPPGALNDYLPGDTAAVVTLDLKVLRDRNLLDKSLGKSLRAALAKDEVGLPFPLFGVDPAVDVDTLRLDFSAGDSGQPLVLLHGRFDRTRFKVGTGQLEEMKQDGFRLYRDDSVGGDTTLALACDTLVASLARPRVVAALRQAAGQRAMTRADDRLKGMLATVDRKRALWFALDLAKLGRPPLPPSIEAQLHPIFEEADTMSGGVAWGEELKADVTFTTRSEANARRLESHLKNVVRFADALVLIYRGEEYERVLLRLLADAQVTHHGTDVTLHSQLGLE